jgi:hypothetical protein
MSRIYLSLLLLIILLTASIYPINPAYSENDIASNIPNVGQLEMRIKQLYEADIKRDFRSWYNLSTHSLKVMPKELQCSYEEFEKVFSRHRDEKYKILSWSIKRITLKKNPPDAAVAVEMDVVTQEMSKQPVKSKDLTDYWVYIDNTWYWTWRGFPYD